MSVNCSSAITSLVAHIEAGGVPFPILFFGADCAPNGFQYPLPGQTLSLNDFNRDLLKNTFCADSSYARCPLPAIQSAIVPPGFQIVFKAKNFFSTAESGQFNLSSQTPGVTKNVFQIDTGERTYAEAPYVWQSVLNNGLPFSDNPLCSPNSDQPLTDPTACQFRPCTKSFLAADRTRLWLNDQKQLTQSLLSCGSPFYPSWIAVSSLDSVDYTRGSFDTSPSYGLPYGFGQTLTVDRACLIPKPNLAAVPAPTLDTSPGLSALLQSPEESVFIYQGLPYTTNSTAFTTTDCGYTALGANGDNEIYKHMCDYLVCENSSRPNLTRIEGSLQSIRFNFQDWEHMRYLYCTGQDTFKLGDVEIQRYKPGSSACDSFMTEFCSNTANLTVPSQAQSCACILEKKRLDAQFTGLDIPVDCFSNVCSDNNPTTYKLASQATGCSAKICQQLIQVHGSDLSAQGFQTLTCQETNYQITPDLNANTTVTGVSLYTANVTPTTSQKDASSDLFSTLFTPMFIMSAAILLVLVTIVIIFVLRRWFIRRQIAQLQNKYHLRHQS